MRLLVKTLMAAVLVSGAVAVQPEPASAQPYWRGPVAGPAYYGYRPIARHYYAPRHRYGYRPVYRGRYYGGYPHRHYRRSFDGGAIAAGLIGGLALGAIAGSVANPYYYPPTYYRPTYYTPARTCFTERRRIVNRYGRVIVRRVQTCY